MEFNKETITQLKNEIAEIEAQINIQQQICDEAQRHINELKPTLVSKKQRLMDIEYYDIIKQFLESATKYKMEYLFRDTSTRKMMTELCRGIYDYYIINYRYVLVNGAYFHYNWTKAKYAYTATEFKQKRYIPEPNTIESEEMIVNLKNGSSVHLFEVPVVIYAQTYDDMDYRKEWNNGELVYEGNNYGDTSTFYLVGIISKYSN